MNLIKSFNKEYLKENIKKSKGLIILFLILVPIFTAIITIFFINQENIDQVVEMLPIASINLIGMYIIPFILSFSLFGYVYKKQSVDFINSMPINRKTIFTTNTIGGIILITIMQIITAVILILCSIFCKNIIIFTGMIFDIFILMWISYIFVFLATNLAMSISGTFLTQLALSMIILFLVPFCIDSFNEFNYKKEINFVMEDYVFEHSGEEKVLAYTMPYNLFSITFNYQESIYSVSSILKMLVLGTFYYIIGLKLFEKRKMENNEESFSSLKMHQAVKALTILPMIILLNVFDADMEVNVIAVAIILVYYFIFDFVVKRKVNLKRSIPYAIATLLIIQGICVGAEIVKEKLPTKEIDVRDIGAVSIGDYRYNQYYSFVQQYGEDIGFIEDREIIEKIIKSAYNLKENSKIKEYSDEYYKNTSNFNICFKTKLGKEFEITVRMYQKDIKEILKMCNENESYKNKFKEIILEDGELYIQNILCNENEKNEISKELELKIKDMSILDYFDTTKQINPKIYKYYYKNHKLITIPLPIDITDKIFEISTNRLNLETKESLEKALKEDDYYANFYIEDFISNSAKNMNYISFDQTSDKIIDFILNNSNDIVNKNEQYYIIKGFFSNHNGEAYFFTNKIEEVDSIISKEVYYNKYEDIEKTEVFYD